MPDSHDNPILAKMENPKLGVAATTATACSASCDNVWVAGEGRNRERIVRLSVPFGRGWAGLGCGSVDASVKFLKEIPEKILRGFFLALQREQIRHLSFGVGSFHGTLGDNFSSGFERMVRKREQGHWWETDRMEGIAARMRHRGTDRGIPRENFTGLSEKAAVIGPGLR